MKIGDLVRPISDSSWWGLGIGALGIVVKLPERKGPHGGTYGVYFGEQKEVTVVREGILHFPYDNHQLEVVSELKD